ncbi:hypothetical protein G7Y79_00073g098160 [Physcia stellaris]|nr:hypothetical protein G7Y79_00073g098160 [Physcia stellaris]
MSNNQHNDQNPCENVSAHVDRPSTPPTQDSSQAIIPEPPRLENLGPVIEVDERYLGPNPASYFVQDSFDSQAAIGDTRSTLTQENPTDIQMRIPDGRVVWVSRRAINMSARTGTPIRNPIVPEVEDTSMNSSRQDYVNHILWETRAFIPQTPTHTPAVTSPNNGTTQIGDAAIPDLDLNVENEDVNRTDEAPAEDFYIVPSDYDVIGNFFALPHGRRLRYEEYILQQQTRISRMPPAPNDRIHLVLPNPRNMPTFQFIMSVPYELGREPVNIQVQLPRHGSPATESDENQMLTFEADIEFELPEGVRREPEGVSRVEYDEASNAQRSRDWNVFGPQHPSEVSRDADLAVELMLPERLAQLQDGEGRGALFEEIQLRGAFRPPHITAEYSAYGEISDEMVYERLRDSRAQWTTRWGWIKDGRRMFGPRLTEAERRDYIRFHIRTNTYCEMYRASDDVLRSIVNLGVYARRKHLDY